MKPERWQQLDSVFHSALERQPEERAAFLDEACARDQQLRKEVEALLAASEQAGSFIEKPALEAEARSLANEQGDAGAESVVGKTIGHYGVIALLGSGGMGEVYLAEDKELARKVALKLLPLYFSKDRERLHRFQQEARMLLALNHPNIVTIHDIGEIDSFYYIASELVEGETLRRCLDKGDLELSDVLEIAIQTAGALAAAHDKGIVHRDIKPENIMIRRDRYVKVLDFGLAKLSQEFAAADLEAPTIRQVHTAEGTVIGTAPYMSPEQARGLKVDARTDIWSLGVLLYEALSGRKPFIGDTTQDVITSILEKEPSPLARFSSDVPETLQWIISRALRKERDARYQTASELLHDLKELKKKLEFEKAFAGEVSSASRVATADAGAGTSALVRPTSSAEYVVSGIRQHKLAALAGLLVLMAGIVGLGVYLHARNTEAAIESIAVLPFVNESGNSDVDYLSDGMTESLINSLSQLPHLSVKARSSVFRYKGKEVEPQKVAAQLSVQAILNGRVVQHGDDLTLYLSLVNAQTGNQIWGEQYNRKLTDLVALQNEIAQDVSQKLRVRLSSADARKLAKTYTENPEAYQLYLKGRHFADQFTEEGFKKAVDHFNQAIEKDPNYALAYAGLAEAYWVASAESLPPREAMPKAREAAVKALKIDEQLAEAHTSLAVVLALYDYDFPGGEREFKRAIELNPNSALAHQWYGYYLASLARADEAFKEIKRAQELDPLSLLINMELGMPFYFTRQYDQAIEQFKRALEMDSNMELARLYLGSSYAQKGMYEEAIAMLSKPESDHPFVLASLGQNYALSGKRSEARKIIDRLNEQSKHRYVSPYGVAKVYLGLGDKEQALRWLEKSYENREDGFIWINSDPAWDSLRSEPRFQSLARRVGLPQ